MTVCRTKEGALTERVARLLLGSPSGIDAEKGQERFGDVSINLTTGRFFDSEDETSGGYIELIQRVKNLHNGEAEAWFDANITNAKPLPLSAEGASERALIGLLAAQPEFMTAIEEEVTVDHFGEIVHKQMFQAIAAATMLDVGQVVSMKTLMDACGGDPLMPVTESYTLAGYIAMIIAETPIVPDTAHFARTLAAKIRSDANREGDVEDQYDIEPEPLPFVPTMDLRMWHEQDLPGPQYEYLIEDLIPERQVVVIMGESGCGKSFLAFHMAMCMARGVPFFGRRILKPVGVIWCAYEASEGANGRMRVYRRHHGLTLDPLPFGVLLHPVSIWPLGPISDTLIAEVQGIERTKFDHKPLGVIVVDTYNAATPGASEIDSEVVSRIRSYFHRIVEETGATLIIIGHTNSAGNLRGNEQLKNNIETLIKVSMKIEAEVQLKDASGLDIRTMTVIKQREGEKGTEFDFVLPSVEDGTVNKFGKARTSCVVVQSESAAPAGVKKAPGLTDQNSNIFSALKRALGDHGEPPPPGLRAKLPRSINVVVQYRYWLDAFAAIAFDKTEKTLRKAMERSGEKLIRLGLIGRDGNYVWLVDATRDATWYATF